jgi:hypothetical protein
VNNSKKKGRILDIEGVVVYYGDVGKKAKKE